MTRVVIDTNVLVSALLNEHGAEAAVLFTVADKKLIWCLSPAILNEYQEVLRRPKFSHLSEVYRTALLRLAAEAEQVTPSFILKESPHEPDNRFLECAETVQADYLVTGNSRHFPKHWKNTKIVNARQLIDLLKK